MLTFTNDLPALDVDIWHVSSDHPHQPGHSFTRGRNVEGLPNLIVHGDDHDRSRRVLSELATQPDLPLEGGRVNLACLDGAHVRLRPIDWRWLQTCSFSGEADRELPLDRRSALHVVLPNDDGLLPGEGDHPERCACCPDLSLPDHQRHHRPFDARDLPWPGVPRPGQDDTPSLVVAADIYLDGYEHDGRLEALGVEPVGDGLVRVVTPPVLADWTTAGAIHELLPAGHEGDWLPRLTDLPILGEIKDRGPRAHLGLALAPSGRRSSEDDRTLTEAATFLADHPGIVITMTPRWLSVATDEAGVDDVERVVGGLVARGLAENRKRYSDPSMGWQCSDLRCSCQQRRLLHPSMD